MSFYRLAEFVAQYGAIDLESLRRFQAELRVLKKGYKPERILPEDLPSEAQIVEIRESIKHPGWRWLYRIIATYGLRSHKVFHLDLERFNPSTEALEFYYAVRFKVSFAPADDITDLQLFMQLAAKLNGDVETGSFGGTIRVDATPERSRQSPPAITALCVSSAPVVLAPIALCERVVMPSLESR